jgi:hypothetical protein
MRRLRRREERVTSKPRAVKQRTGTLSVKHAWGRPPQAGRVCVACSHAGGLHAGKRLTASLEPDGPGTTSRTKCAQDRSAARAMSGDYLGGRAARRFAGTPLRCLVTGFLVSAASNNCRNPCANSSTAFPRAPSCPTRTIATDRCRSNDGGRNTFTVSIERFLAMKRAGSSPTP